MDSEGNWRTVLLMLESKPTGQASCKILAAARRRWGRSHDFEVRKRNGRKARIVRASALRPVHED